MSIIYCFSAEQVFLLSFGSLLLVRSVSVLDVVLLVLGVSLDLYLQVSWRYRKQVKIFCSATHASHFTHLTSAFCVLSIVD